MEKDDYVVTTEYPPHLYKCWSVAHYSRERSLLFGFLHGNQLLPFDFGLGHQRDRLVLSQRPSFKIFDGNVIFILTNPECAQHGAECKAWSLMMDFVLLEATCTVSTGVGRSMKKELPPGGQQRRVECPPSTFGQTQARDGTVGTSVVRPDSEQWG